MDRWLWQGNGACGVLGGLGKGPHDRRGVKTHMGFNQEVYGAGCAATVRALDLAAERQAVEATREGHDLHRCTCSHHTHADMRGGPGAPHKRARPWLNHGPGRDPMVSSSRKPRATKLRTDGQRSLDSHGIECLRHSDKYGRKRMPLPAPHSHKRRISEKRWKEAQEWSLARTKNRRIDTKRLKQTTDPVPAKAPKRIAARYYQLKTRHALTATHMKTVKLRTDDQCWRCHGAKQTREHLFSSTVPRGELSKWQCGPWCRSQRSAGSVNGRWPSCSRTRGAARQSLSSLGRRDMGRKVPTERATEAESSESGTEQECPRGECVCGCGLYGS